jgi:hypothetical protein
MSFGIISEIFSQDFRENCGNFRIISKQFSRKFKYEMQNVRRAQSKTLKNRLSAGPMKYNASKLSKVMQIPYSGLK